MTNGIFLDYFAPQSLKSHLAPNTSAIDIPNRAAAIPGDGNVPVTFTYTYDVAQYVVQALSMERWEKETRVVGDTVTWNEFVAVAEQILGQSFACLKLASLLIGCGCRKQIQGFV